MRDVILDLPLELLQKEVKLFEYVSFKKVRKTPEVYVKKVRFTIFRNIAESKPLFHSQSQPKAVMIKNIANMNKTHCVNALNYALSKADESLGINYLGEEVNVEQTLENWNEDFSDKANAKVALHLVFSLNETHSSNLMDILKISTRQTLESNLAEYKWLMVPHSHQNKPHIHVFINKKNIFTRKNLHFNSKQEVANFFESMREDFKYNLLAFSCGKLDYTNEVRFDKAFRQSHRDSKLEKLSSFTQEDTLIDDLAFLKEYKSAILSVSSKRKICFLQSQNLQKDLRNKSIYLANVERKITQSQENGKKPINLLEKAKSLRGQIKELGTKIKKLQVKISRLDSHVAHFLDWESNFSSFCKNFNIHNKKKALVKSFSGFEQYIPLDLSKKLEKFRKDIAHAESMFKSNIDSISDSVLLEQDITHKTNGFKLSKRLSQLHYYKSILQNISFVENPNLHEKSKTLQNELEAQAQKLLQMSIERLKFVFRILRESAEQEAKEKQEVGFSLDSYADSMRAKKKSLFLEKELLALEKILRKNKVDIKELKQEIVAQNVITKTVEPKIEKQPAKTIKVSHLQKSKVLDSKSNQLSKSQS